MAGPEVAAVLLREAQQEIALLRTDLFNTRRLSEERRQAVEALQAERERLARHCDDVESSLRSANAQLNHVPELQQRCLQLEAGVRRLQSELETSVAARRILEQELDDERRQRATLLEQKALLEGERARLAKQRDDLAAQVRVEQNKAREAEEEQVRAEEDAAALRAEVSALQQVAATAASAATPPARAPSPPPAAPGSATPATTGPTAADTAAAIAASVAAATTPLLEQLEHERSRATALLGSLHAAKAEIMDLTQRLSAYEVRHADMLARGHHDPEHLAHELLHLREHKARLEAQLAAAEDRVRQLAAAEDRVRQLEDEATQLRAVAETAATAAAQKVQSAAPAPPLPPQPLAQPSTAGDAYTAAGGDVAPGEPHSSIASRFFGMAGRIASTGSLYGGAPGSETDGGAAAHSDDAVRLRNQVARLKASRDKLLAEIDKQWGEIERLSAENTSLTEELRAQRTLATNWERQAQDGISQVEQLKDLLEDSARWTPASAAAAAPGVPSAAATDAVGPVVGSGGPTVQSMQMELLGEKARATELELQVRALAAEVLRCQHSSLDLGRSFLPMMAGVEKRLAELCRRARNT